MKNKRTIFAKGQKILNVLYDAEFVSESNKKEECRVLMKRATVLIKDQDVLPVTSGRVLGDYRTYSCRKCLKLKKERTIT
jgi:hypothetical protein